MTEKQNKRHMYRRLIALVVLVLFIVGGTWALSILREEAQEEPGNVRNTDFNGNVIRLELRKSMGQLQWAEPEELGPSRNVSRNRKEQDPARILLLAERDMENGDFAAAEDRLRTALVFHGKNVKMYALLGKALYLQEKYKAAESVFRQQVYLAPEDSVSMNNLSAALAKQKRYHEAIGTLHQLLKNDPSSASAVLNLAGMYAVSGDKKNAIAYFRKAYELLGHRILFLAQDRNFVSIQQEPEFIRIVREAKNDFLKNRREDASDRKKAGKKETK
ncbi:MAG: tetratricopeptide repeat protein [Lentisphaeria bacterium]|nr:tetratricopeptide repeat protein [Lentisphaeria bacterium]